MTETVSSSPTVAAGRVGRLAAQAADAAQVRALTTDPDVIALRVERVRSQVDALLWAGIVLGLAFTMVNVQGFAAAGSQTFSAGWWVAWLLDPMVSLVLLAVLRAEQVTARYQVALPAWGRRTKWLTFAATYVMNTWTSWGLAEQPFSAAGVVLHSVPPLVVFATAETGPGLRDRLTEAVHRALTEHRPASAEAVGQDSPGVPASRPALDGPALPAVAGAASREPVREPAREPRPSRRPASGRRARKPAPRRLLTDFVAEARAARARIEATGDSVEVTPTWCREVTGCSAGTSVKVAAALRAEPLPSPSVISPATSRPSAGEEVAA
jgi:hypothetical protein